MHLGFHSNDNDDNTKRKTCRRKYPTYNNCRGMKVHHDKSKLFATTINFRDDINFSIVFVGWWIRYGEYINVEIPTDFIANANTELNKVYDCEDKNSN